MSDAGLALDAVGSASQGELGRASQGSLCGAPSEAAPPSTSAHTGASIHIHLHEGILTALGGGAIQRPETPAPWNSSVHRSASGLSAWPADPSTMGPGGPDAPAQQPCRPSLDLGQSVHGWNGSTVMLPQLGGQQPSWQGGSPQRRRRRRWVRLLAAAGGTVAAAVLGAGAAMFLLSPRLHVLQGLSTEALRQQRHLHSALAQLSSAKHELADQMAAVREDNARLTAELLTLRQEREAAAAEGGSSSDEARAGAGGVPAPAMQQQGPGSFAPASTGDLSVQVNVPGFTCALVNQVKEAGLVHSLSESLVKEVNDKGLLPEFAAAVVDRAGSQFANSLCFWRWGRRRRQRQEEEGESGGSAAD